MPPTPGAADLLNDAQLTPAEKMDRLRDAAYYQVEARKLASPSPR